MFHRGYTEDKENSWKSPNYNHTKQKDILIEEVFSLKNGQKQQLREAPSRRKDKTCRDPWIIGHEKNEVYNRCQALKSPDTSGFLEKDMGLLKDIKQKTDAMRLIL